MPIREIVGEFLGGMLRSIIVDVVWEILIRGPGYLICRRFNKAAAPDDGWVAVIGVVFWGVLGVLGYLAYLYLSEAFSCKIIPAFGFYGVCFYGRPYATRVDAKIKYSHTCDSMHSKGAVT